jgi:hypothetical protein
MDVNAGLSKLALETSGSAPKSKDRLVAEMFDGKDEEITAGGAGLNFEALVPLKAGLLVNQQYAVSPKQLNKIIFEQGRLCTIGSNVNPHKNGCGAPYLRDMIKQASHSESDEENSS